jgi:hypothetical protein
MRWDVPACQPIVCGMRVPWIQSDCRLVCFDLEWHSPCLGDSARTYKFAREGRSDFYHAVFAFLP